MKLHLHYHPLSSYCWKVLIALYEAELTFERTIVNLGDEASRTAFYKLWPIGKMPVLVDEDAGVTVPETTVIFDYLAGHAPSAAGLIPSDPERAWRERLLERLFDHYVMDPMGRVVGDRLRPADAHDPFGVEQAFRNLRSGCDYLEGVVGQDWAAGDSFGRADCAAAPALFYADKVAPLAANHPRLAAYLARLQARPSFARVLEEAQPYLHMFPG